MSSAIWRLVTLVVGSGFTASQMAGASATISLTSSVNPLKYGQPTVLAVMISPADATGKVTFYDGVTILGTGRLSNGKAAFTTTLLAPGARSITAYYSGDTHYAPNRSTVLSQVVNSIASDGYADAGPPGAGANISSAVADFNGDGKADIVLAGNCLGFAARFCTPQTTGLSVALGNGDGTFQPIVRYTIGTSTFVTTGDFDGDGVVDLAVAQGDVSVLLGNGDGTFRAAVKYPAGGVTLLFVGDFNGDGIADLAGSAEGGVSLLLGNGDGSFQAPAIYSVGGKQVTSLALADVNGDGMVDVVACNGTSLSVLLGNGDGTLRSPVDYGAGDLPMSVAVGDFNGDGKVDIVAGGFQSPTGISLLPGNGDGTFQPARQFPVKDYSAAAGPYGAVYAIAANDLNGDGKVDLAIVTRDVTPYFPLTESRAFLNVFFGNGDGTFQPQVAYTSFISKAVGFADFNGDGRLDLAAAAYVFLGIPPTTTTLTSSLNPSIYGQSVTLTANVSATVSSGGAKGNVMFYEGSTVLGTVAVAGGQASLTTSSLSPGNYSITAAYGGDNENSKSTSTVLIQTVGLIGTSTVTSSPASSTYGQNVTLSATVSSGSEAAPVTGNVMFQDGALLLGTRILSGGTASLSIATFALGAHSVRATYSGDLFHSASTSPVVTLNVTQGAMVTPMTVLTTSANPITFGQRVTLAATISATGGLPGSGKVTFYDGTTVLGASDVVSGKAALSTSLLASGTRSLRAYYGGNASYTASLSAVTTQAVNSIPAIGFRVIDSSIPNVADRSVAPPQPDVADFIAAADFNEDGKVDLAAPGIPGSVGIYRGNGDGTFGSGTMNSLGGTPSIVVVGDFNGDGHADIAVSNGIDVSVLLGNGDGSLQPAVHYRAGASIGSLVVADFNRDGRADLAVLNAAGVSLLLGNGDGTFQAGVDTAAFASSVAVGDFNGDGTPDLVVANYYSFSVLLGLGDGTFQTLGRVARNGPVSVVVGDFNGDGKADLAIGGFDVGVSYVEYLAVYAGNGDGTFQAGQYSTLTGSAVVTVVAGDFNGDGKADLAVKLSPGFTLGALPSNGVAMFMGNGDGTFRTAVEYNLTGPIGPSAGPLTAGDFNGDGRMDLATFTATGISFLLGTSEPSPTIRAVANAASLVPGPVASGSMAIVYGDFLSDSTRADGLSIQIADMFVPILSVAPGQVTIQLPWEASGPISALVNGRLGADHPLSFAGFAPGIFTTNGQGSGQGAILDSAYRLLDAANPATAGSVVQIFCTGLGAVSNLPPTGSPAPVAPLAATFERPMVTIGGATAEVQFSGLTPGGVGLYQVNAIVPAEASKGVSVPVVISIQGNPSNTVTMAVR